MARYSFRCPACGNKETRTIPIASYNAAAELYCPCGGQLARVFDPPLIIETGKWRDQISRIGPSAFMRREDRLSPGGE